MKDEPRIFYKKETLYIRGHRSAENVEILNTAESNRN